MSPEEACAALGKMAGWTTPPDDADPYVVDLALRLAQERLDAVRAVLVPYGASA